MSIVELAPALDAIPMVADAASRDLRFPFATRVQNQRVFRLDTGVQERWTGSAWVDDTVPIVDSGYIGGIPIGDDVRTKKLEILAGVLRQDSVDKTKWSFLQDTQHAMVGFNGVYSNVVGSENLFASGGSLTVRYKKTYKRCVSLIVAPDETLSNVWHVSVGGSVGLDRVVISARFSQQVAGQIFWDGTAWQNTMGTYQGAVPVLSYDTGTLTVTHGFCPGAALSVVPFSNNATVNPYMPVVRVLHNGDFAVQFVDTTTGNLVSGAPSTKMAFYWSKVFDGPANLDGSNGHDAIQFYNPGNFWVYGIMEAT